VLTLEWPQLLWLLPLPILIYFLAPAAKKDSAALLVPFYDRLQQNESQTLAPANSSKIKLLAMTLIWIAAVLACARPMWIGDPINLPASGRDLLLAVDISGSMETPDMEWQGETINRLVTVKKVVGDFVQRRESDRLGLILFGTRAYLQAPLTFDRTTVDRLLQEAQLGFAGEKTAIGDAIALSVKRLRDRPQESRVLILLTDGANTAGEIQPLKAAELAAQSQVKIYTIGIGADEMIKPGLFGTGFGARRINPSADLDEDTLRTIASSTGGQYFRARSLQDLQQIYAVLDTLEPSEQDSEVFRPTKSLFYWPLSLAFAISALWLLLHIAMPALPAINKEVPRD
jgi:Ca-activated chloride channel family protein